MLVDMKGPEEGYILHIECKKRIEFRAIALEACTRNLHNSTGVLIILSTLVRIIVVMEKHGPYLNLC